jgi:hypothetical protein
MIINCPVCGGQLTITPQHFGQNVNCPHCARVFQVPAPAQQPVPQTPQYPPQPAQSPMAGPVPPHLQQSPAAQPQPAGNAPGQPVPGQAVPDEEASDALATFREKRDKASSKTIIWVIVIAVGVPVVIGLMLLLFVVQKSGEESQDQKRTAKETRSRAINMAKNNLSARGYTVQTDKIKVSGGNKAPVVNGWATKDEESYEFECKFRITETPDKVAWSVDYIEIDGEVIYSN